MVTKKSTSGGPGPQNDAESEAQHSQNIWLAGLGAFAKAQAEGTKAFEALVHEGLDMQRKTQAMAQERLAEATQQMEALAARAGSAATERWDRFEGIFEDRVARAMGRLGMPTAADVQRLTERIEALERAVASMQEQAPTGTRTRNTGTQSD